MKNILKFLPILQEPTKIRMLYLFVLLAFLQVFHFAEVNGEKGIVAKRAEAMSIVLSPDADARQKNEASNYLGKVLNKLASKKKTVSKPKAEPLKRAVNIDERDDETDDYVNYQIPSNELWVNVFDYDGILNGTNWLVFEDSDLEPTVTPPTPKADKLEALKRFFLGFGYK